MGLKTWFSKRIISGLTNALCMNYRTVLRENPGIPIEDASKQALRMRYRIIRLPQVQEIALDLFIQSVNTLHDACSTAVLLELKTAKDFPLNDEQVEHIITDILQRKGIE